MAIAAFWACIVLLLLIERSLCETFNITYPQNVYKVEVPASTYKLYLNLTWEEKDIYADIYLYHEGEDFLSTESFCKGVV